MSDVKQILLLAFLLDSCSHQTVQHYFMLLSGLPVDLLFTVIPTN